MTSLITQQPVTPSQMPLALRSNAHRSTIEQASGFGVQLAQATAIERTAAQLFAAVVSAGPVPAGTGTGRSAGADAFSLRQPDMARVAAAAGPGSERLTPEAMLTRALGSLQQVLQRSGLEAAKQRLQHYQAKALANTHYNNQLAAALEKALSAAEAAGAAAEAAADEAGVARGALEAARDEVAARQAELDAMDPDDPGLAAKQGELQAAQQRLQTSQSHLEEATRTLLAAGGAFNAALEQVQLQRDQMGAGARRGAGSPPLDGRELTAAATLQKLLVMLSTLSADVALEKLKSETEAIMAALQAREAQNKEAVRKQEEEAQRAADAEKKTGCIGKVFKWAAAAISVVVLAVGVLTANPALIAAGIISVAMTLDGMAGEHLGFSVMGKLTDVIGAGISKALVAVGVNEALAKKIGSIAASIVVVVMVIAASIMAGNMANALQASSAATRAASAAASTAGRVAEMAEKAVQVVQVLGQLASLAGSVTQGVGQIVVAGIMVEVARLMKAIEENLFGSEVLRDLIGKIRDAVALLDNLAFELLTQSSNVMRESDATGRTIINAMRA